MIYRTARALDTSVRYDQTNNTIERFLKDLKTSGQTKFWLESCNVESTACAVEAVACLFKLPLPIVSGHVICGYGDLIFSFLYSNYGQAHAPHVKDGLAENEIIENLAFAVKEMTNAKATVHYNKDIKSALLRKSAVVLCYQTDYDSGHYITVVGYDSDRDTYLCYDSWADNKHCRKRGVLEEYSSTFFSTRMRPWFMEVSR